MAVLARDLRGSRLWRRPGRRDPDEDRGGVGGKERAMRVGVIGVPFNSTGRGDGVALAPGALRRAGLLPRLAAVVDAGDLGDVDVGAVTAQRSPRSGLLNEQALIATIQRTRQAVAAADEAGRFPLVLGGDCPVMLGGLAATRDRYGDVGLVMVDGHQDNYPPQQSPTGEAADCELFLALGLPADGLPDGLTALTPLLQPHQVSLLGARDEATIVRDGVASLRERCQCRPTWRSSFGVRRRWRPRPPRTSG
jgi:arginase